MHAQVLVFAKNIFDRFDGKTSSKMGESGNFLNQGNPNAMERPLIRQFSVTSSNSSDFPMLEFGVIDNEKP